MHQLIEQVYGIWNNIGQMGRETNLDMYKLLYWRDIEQLPPASADAAILKRAEKVGAPITAEALDAYRNKPPMSYQQRWDLIDDFFKEAGGYDQVARRTGMRPAHLRGTKAKAKLTQSCGKQFRNLAKEIGYSLPEEIFTTPPPRQEEHT